MEDDKTDKTDKAIKTPKGRRVWRPEDTETNMGKAKKTKCNMSSILYSIGRRFGSSDFASFLEPR